ncbi:MAG: NADPH:quinone oxidoreductase family protein [Zoogloea oleivorans]|jgi:NADPH2:quinone reductase|uniref:NADPH:quinone oxidoreductase family protein n=1 Tax=Zoogloea oleivorans TaxID=1552750 RepID=UPI002A36D5B3|nr:NADPH:quinone oxidoreductase family protein [Zoogloea oleivorans]MDY0038520.1 NADPH:quinone oxidoreductase family protein [Zoogloea oleivorans]
MKAVVCKRYGPPEDLVVETLTDPTPGPRQLRVRIHAAGVNYPDALLVQGLHQYRPEPPFLFGGELAGVVDAVGSKVTEFAVGQRVYASRLRGAFAEAMVVDIDKVQRIPESLSFEEAACLSTTYNTAYYALITLGRLKAGETILILGAAGGVGLAAVEIAKALGARVLAAASSTGKLAVCERVGADVLIDYQKDDLRQRLRAEAPTGVDVVYDPIGGARAEAALRGLAWRGRYLVVGFASGEIPKIPLNLVLLKGAEIVGVFLGETWTREPETAREIDSGMAKLIGEGRIHPYISARYPMERIADALTALLERRVSGKIVILPRL